MWCALLEVPRNHVRLVSMQAARGRAIHLIWIRLDTANKGN